MGWTKEGPGDNESRVEGGETGRERHSSALSPHEKAMYELSSTHVL